MKRPVGGNPNVLTYVSCEPQGVDAVIRYFARFL